MMELFLRLFNMSITASWLILAVLVVRPFLSKAPKWIRGILWGLVGVRLMFPISFESVWSLIPSKEILVPNAVEGAAPTFTSGIEAVDVSVNTYLQQRASVEMIAAARNEFPLENVFLGIWLLGIFGFVLYSIFSYLQLHRLVLDAVKYQDNIFQSERITSPFVLGVVKPRIYVPYHLDEEALACVTAHERAHIKRKDHLIKPLGFMLVSVHWFNPIVWVAYYYLCQDIELACDEKVIHELGFDKKKVYSQTLLECSAERHFVRACPVAFGEIGVGKRVKNILEMKKTKIGIVVAALLVCVVVAVCFLSNPQSEEMDVVAKDHVAASANQEADEQQEKAEQAKEDTLKAEQDAKEAEQARKEAEETSQAQQEQETVLKANETAEQVQEAEEQAKEATQEENAAYTLVSDETVASYILPFKSGTDYYVTAVFDSPEFSQINVSDEDAELDSQAKHLGMDFAAEMGTDIISCSNGKVKEAGFNADNGNYIVIEDEAGYTWYYMHLEACSVKQGDSITQGSVIGTLGSTGRSTGPHLHLEVQNSNGECMDPATLFGL